MNDRCILAIDQGTTGSTVILFDHRGEIAGKAYSEFTQHFPNPGWVEHDASEIWEVTLRCIREALNESGITAEQVAAIGITNQRETTVLWDRASGEPVAPAIVWQDRRTADTCTALKNAGHEELFRQRTGLVLDPYFSGTKVQWLLDHHDGLRERAERGEIAFGTIDSWLIFKLTGGAVHATDYSNASRTLMYNIRELEWDGELLERLNVPAAILPGVQASSGRFGTTAAGLLGAEIPISGVAGDQQSALFGQACYEAGMSKNTYGTGSFMLLNTGAEVVGPCEGLLTTIAWRLGDAPVQYALEGSVFITGAAVQWLRDGLGLIASAAETDALASSLDGNDDVYFVPALAGLGTPHWDPAARGAIVGITRGTTRAHLARATLEGIAYQCYDVVKAMETASGAPLVNLRVDGGAVHNAFLMQFQSDLLGVPVEVPKVAETTALGAAYLAGLGVGFWQGTDELAEHWRLHRGFEPSMADGERQRLHRRWLDAVGRAKGWAAG